jgi:protein-L-isoaspartate(D-aspartate) O-methyltransferase
MQDFTAARKKMVDSQLRTQAVTDYDVLRVMGDVPRERFVPPSSRALSYIDHDILTQAAGDGAAARYLMEPAPFARLLQAGQLRPADIVLDVGCGTGYSAAVLARLANSVVALESDAGLAARASETLMELGIDNAAVVSGPLEAGYPAEGPYDVIILEGSVEVVPESLLQQLKDGGRLVAVVGQGRSAAASVYTRSGDDFGRLSVFDADVKPLPGFRKPRAFVF